MKRLNVRRRKYGFCIIILLVAVISTTVWVIEPYVAPSVDETSGNPRVNPAPQVSSGGVGSSNFNYSWTGFIYSVGEMDYRTGSDNFTFIDTTTFFVSSNHGGYASTHNVNNETRITTDYNPASPKEGCHEWVFIHPNVSLSDTVNISISLGGGGDHNFTITDKVVFEAMGRNFSTWKLTDSEGSVVYYDSFSGLLVNGTFVDIPGYWYGGYQITGTNATLETNEIAPVLMNGLIDPNLGGTTDVYNFSIDYQDPDNNAPITVDLVVNGSTYAMERVNGLDEEYITGVTYYRTLYLLEGNYSTTFRCSDYEFSYETAAFLAPNVTRINTYSPVLSNEEFSPSEAYKGKIFHFQVNYTDMDNNPPSFLNITINSTGYLMQKVNLADNVALDGILYYVDVILETAGEMVYFFNCSDGVHEVRHPIAGTFSGPKVLALHNYTRYDDLTFSWEDISESGTRLVMIDDDSSTQLLPFNFPFYNETYSTIYVSSNGYCSFINPDPISATNIPFPTIESQFQRMIALFWDDLDPRGHESVFVQNSSSLDQWILQYASVLHYPFLDEVVEGTFQLVLYSTGDIQFNFLNISYHDGYTCGLNLGDGQFFSTVTNLTIGLTNRSIRFSYNDSDLVRPVISNTGIDAASGTTATEFRFYLTYTHTSNIPPSSVNVIIDDVAYTMVQEDAGDDDYSDGAIFEYITKLPVGNHKYNFEVSDGFFLIKSPASDTNEGPIVSNFVPVLSNPSLNSTSGNTETKFRFSVIFSDADNHAAQSVRVVIDTIAHDMVKVNSTDSDYLVGVEYEVVLTLPAGEHTYHFIASDGFDSTILPASTEYSGPSVSPASGDNWWLIAVIGGIISIPIIIGAVYFFKKRKRILISSKIST